MRRNPTNVTTFKCLWKTELLSEWISETLNRKSVLPFRGGRWNLWNFLKFVQKIVWPDFYPGRGPDGIFLWPMVTLNFLIIFFFQQWHVNDVFWTPLNAVFYHLYYFLCYEILVEHLAAIFLVFLEAAGIWITTFSMWLLDGATTRVGGWRSVVEPVTRPVKKCLDGLIFYGVSFL
jgi:hypothetical protein